MKIGDFQHMLGQMTTEELLVFCASPHTGDSEAFRRTMAEEVALRDRTKMKLWQALQTGEFDRYLLGLGEYHFEGWNDLPNYNDYGKCWTLEVVPFQKSPAQARMLNEVLTDTLLLILDSSYDPAIVLDSCCGHVFEYVWKKYHSPEFYSEKNFFLTLDVGAVLKKYRVVLEDNKQALMSDKRWYGVEWNSSGRGLYGPLLDWLERPPMRGVEW